MLSKVKKKSWIRIRIRINKIPLTFSSLLIRKLHKNLKSIGLLTSEKKTIEISLTDDDDEDAAGRRATTIAYGLPAGKLKMTKYLTF